MHFGWEPDLRVVMNELAQRRPVFHSESDFQHEIAWQLRLHGYGPRLEYPSQLYPGRASIDLLVLTASGKRLAIELKYRTRRIDERVRGERFVLSRQAANDHGRYDFLKDVTRVERLVSGGEADAGAAILLTNDPLYWRPTGRSNVQDAAFRIHENTRLPRRVGWRDGSGLGSTQGREQELVFAREYPLLWFDYQSECASPALTFRFCLLHTHWPSPKSTYGDSTS